MGPHGPINEEARWAKPPEEAKYILVVLDPDDKLYENDEENNVLALRIHSPSEVFENAIPQSNVGAGRQIKVSFKPGYPKLSLTMSEAEVVAGVDHFNFASKFIDPPFQWQVWNDIQFSAPSPLGNPNLLQVTLLDAKDIGNSPDDWAVFQNTTLVNAAVGGKGNW